MPETAAPLVPKPDKVRERLAECLQEARVLRGLLRVSMKAEQLRKAGDSPMREARP